MKKFQKLLWTTAVVMMAMLGACVTINIYFPAEKVESVAGDIVNDIRGQQPSKKDNQSKSHEGLSIQIRFALGAASAWAEDVTTVSKPTIRALKEKMKARFQELKA